MKTIIRVYRARRLAGWQMRDAEQPRDRREYGGVHAAVGVRAICFCVTGVSVRS